MQDSISNFDPVKKILLIEDDVSYGRLVDILLEDSNLLECVVTQCLTLEEGMQKIREEGEFDAILLDLKLPDSSGFQTLEKLLTQFPESNIIVMTGAADKELGIRSVKAGAQDFLIKSAPLNGDELAKSLRFSIERNTILNRLEETQRLARIGNWECYNNGELFFATDEVYRIFGMEPRKTILNCAEIQDPDHPLLIFKEIHEETGVKKKMKRDMWVRRLSGDQCFVSILCRAASNPDGTTTFVGVIQDVTERKQSEDLRKAKDIAEQSAKVREQVLASVSHEMRTPMTAILGMSNLLLNGNIGEEEEKEYIRAINQSSETLLGIINDILQMSTIQQEQITFKKERFDLGLLMGHLRKVMEYKLKEKNLLFSMEVSKDIPPALMGDKLRLNQILYNLIGNAIKFTDEGSVTLKLDKKKQCPEAITIEFQVKDTGIGIPKDKQALIFETFTRLRHKDRLYEGTGLGLSIAKYLVEKQGGSIWVNSEEGQGACFCFELDFGMTQSETIDTPEADQQEADYPNEIEFDILLVEDHQINQLVVRKTIEKKWKNVRISIANNGEEAIELLGKRGFDLILMDILMPVKDGFETTDFIRKNMPPEVANIPILAMTAHAHISKEDNLKKFGLNDFVLKPFNPNQLYEKIEQYLKK